MQQGMLLKGRVMNESINIMELKIQGDMHVLSADTNPRGQVERHEMSHICLVRG